MRKLIYLFAFAFMLSSCSKFELTPCMDEKFDTFKTDQNTCDQGASIKAYTFQNDTVFVLNPGICIADYQAEVVNDDCESLGFLFGISGNDIINGEQFSTNAELIEEVWDN